MMSFILHNISYATQKYSASRRLYLFCSAVSSMLVLLFFFVSPLNGHSQAVDAGSDLPPNEMGSVMILMYHDIRKPESTWVRTPENFKKDLQALYDRNFRPISLEDLINRRFDIPKGTSPVVLTFDDGTLGQFQMVDGPNGSEIASNCAVGILERFHAAHPDFPLEATFFVNGKRPFKQSEYVVEKLNYIVTRGMDVGNHTSGHQNLRSSRYASADAIQKAIGKQAVFLEQSLVDHPAYIVRTLALCFGQRPRRPSLLRYLVAGVFKGTSYENAAILNVGSAPSYSPLDRRFNPQSIPRIRASESNTGGVELYDWLRRYEKRPFERFVSDGDPSSFTVPRCMKDNVAPERLRNAAVNLVDCP